jgi:hypothetical protein
MNLGTLSFLGSLDNAGTLVASQGVLTIETLSAGAGTLEVAASGTLALLAGASSCQPVNFLGSGGLLEIADTSQFAATLAGFGGANKIGLLSLAANSLSYSAGSLTVKEGSAVVASRQFSGSYATGSFTLGPDGNGGSLIGFK